MKFEWDPQKAKINLRRATKDEIKNYEKNARKQTPS